MSDAVPSTTSDRLAGHTQDARSTPVHWVNQYAVTPEQPGGTRHFEMAAALRCRGYDVRLVASDFNLTLRAYTRRGSAKDRRAIYEEVQGVPFAWLPAGEYRRNDWRRAVSMLIFAWHVFGHLVRTVRRHDVVIGSTPHLPAAAAARLASLLRGGHFILEVRDLWPETLVGVSGRGGVIARLLRVLADVLYRTSSAIVILAEGSREPIVRHGGPPKRIVFIPNGVDVEGFRHAVGALPRALGWVERAPTFVYAGAHGEANGLDQILDAAEVLVAKGRPDIKLLLVGDGPEKENLRRAAAKRGLSNVAFEDPVPKSDIPAILRHCAGGLMILRDVELFRYGVSPNKLFDYLACDLPVVTNVPGDVADIVKRTGSGIVVPPRDPVALADALVSIADGWDGAGWGSRYIAQHHNRPALADRLGWVIDAVARRETTWAPGIGGVAVSDMQRDEPL